MDRNFQLLRTIWPHITILVLFIAIHCRSQELNSLDSVAIEALDAINPLSIKECREYGGDIKMRPTGFQAGEPIRGDKDGIEIQGSRFTIAFYHSHGCRSVLHRNEEFSEQDTLDVEQYEYLITPRSRILKFDHVDRRVYELDRHAMVWEPMGRESLVWSVIP